MALARCIGRFAWVVAVLMAACGQQGVEKSGGSPTQPTPLPTSPPTSPTPPAPSSSPLENIALEPRAVNGGTPVVATIRLNAPASAPRSIGLASDNPAVVVPPSVTVQAGSATAAFAVSTSPAQSDVKVTITGSLDGASVQSTLAVWSIAPTSFWYDISPRASPIDAVGRYTGDTATFRATCDVNGMHMSLSQPSSNPRELHRWELAFLVASGMPMRPGTYDVQPGLWRDVPPPRMRINGPSIFNGYSYVCSEAQARFVVEEIAYRATGEVDRFVAKIEQECPTGHFRGEIRLTSPPRPAGPAGTCFP